jgi:site-specific recombinase XerD
MSTPQHQPPGLFEILRQEMQLKGYSHETMKAYRSCIRAFVRYLQPKHPREASDADIREFLLHLVDNEDYAESTVNQVINALRYLYVELYQRPMALGDIPRPRKEQKLPDILL